MRKFKPRNPVPALAAWMALLAAIAGMTLQPATGIAQDGDRESSHVELGSTQDISAEEAERVYQSLRERMKQGYMLSKFAFAADYQDWRRYNSAPYLSKQHGNRHLNNYANMREFDFANPKEGLVYPAGTILAKDAFSVTDHEDVYPAALFIMEKLAAGTSPQTADWRYVAIFPDGSVEGDTTGDFPENVEYCHQCHEQVKDQDYLFGVPENVAVQ